MCGINGIFCYKNDGNLVIKNELLATRDHMLGGTAWVPKLGQQLKDKGINIYNLGVSGTGIEHFNRLLASFKEKMAINHIVILAISDDFQRRYWYPSIEDKQIRFCPEHVDQKQCQNKTYIAKVIDKKISKEALLKEAEIISEYRKQELAKRKPKEFFHLVALFNSIFKKTINIPKHHFKYSLGSLQMIRENFPDTSINFIHLPEKYEVSTGKYRLRYTQEIKELGISYFPALDKCEWDMQMFFKNDGHPNQKGYDNIARLFKQCDV